MDTRNSTAIDVCGLVHPSAALETEAAAGAASLAGLPVSVLRDEAASLGRILNLSRRVLPMAGLCLAYPSMERKVSLRLSLQTT
jgi:hypothetical protein